jgi:glycosyltransferase involved in cell wall biosynthesis
MLWSNKIKRYIERQKYDLMIQFAPGLIMPVAGSLAKNRMKRTVLYGDNRAMWSQLAISARFFKWVAFSALKGPVYMYVNHRADRIFGYTPNTQTRLRAFSARKKMELLPLSFDPDVFTYDEELRAATRVELGYQSSDVVVVAPGKFARRKRLDLLIQAITDLSPRHPNLRLLLVGADNSECSVEIRRSIAIGQRSKFIRLHDFVDSGRLNALMNASDIGIWPTMPAITIQQGLGTGLYTLLPRNDLVGHLLKSGTGAYFDVDHTEMQSVLARAIEDAANINFDSNARQLRSTVNAWLGADHSARRLLRL